MQNRLCLILFGLLFQKVSRRAAIERKTAKSPHTITTKTAWVRRQDAAFRQNRLIVLFYKRVVGVSWALNVVGFTLQSRFLVI